MNKAYERKWLLLFAVAAMCALCAAGCGGSVKLDPKKPVAITVWHYYNGPALSAFDSMVTEFNKTAGGEWGVTVEAYAFDSASELETEAMASAHKEIGSMEMPNIFASCGDTAYAAERLGLLADLGQYFTLEEQSEYLPSFIEEGKIGPDDELKIFPVTMTSEIMMINETDWLPFARANNLSYGDLSTMEDVAWIAKLYYQWSGGKSFFGRDDLANLFIVASREFDTELFAVSGGEGSVNINRDAMRRVWDCYYVPYISGYYASDLPFRREDVKAGNILCYVGAGDSAASFPQGIVTDTQIYPITLKVLPAPHFEGPKKIMMQQGAGMVVTKGTKQQEYASLLFLKWFTQSERNREFSVMAGCLPVNKDAVERLSGADADAVLRAALDEMEKSELYAAKAFNGSVETRAILETYIQERALTDREAVLQLMELGTSHEEAVARYATVANFNTWLENFSKRLEEAAAIPEAE